MRSRAGVGLVVGAVAFGLLLLLPAPAGLSDAAWRTAAVGVLMATWWVTEAIPIPATALLPLALFPVLGIGSIGEAAGPFANPLIYLFLGGFLLAQAMQGAGLPRRIALDTVRLFGTRPGSVIGGIMAASAFLSMWVSNTATALMMLPIGLSLIELLPGGEGDPDRARFGTALMLSIAYACSIGGMGTLIGTPPNAFLAGFMLETYGVSIGFAQWMLLGVPLVGRTAACLAHSHPPRVPGPVRRDPRWTVVAGPAARGPRPAAPGREASGHRIRAHGAGLDDPPPASGLDSRAERRGNRDRRGRRPVPRPGRGARWAAAPDLAAG